jgi:hypothetical protein
VFHLISEMIINWNKETVVFMYSVDYQKESSSERFSTYYLLSETT